MRSQVTVYLNANGPKAFEILFFFFGYSGTESEQGNCHLSRGQVVVDQNWFFLGGVKKRSFWISWESALSIKQLHVKQEGSWASSSGAYCGCGSWERCRKLQDLILTHPFWPALGSKVLEIDFNSSFSHSVSCILGFSANSVSHGILYSAPGLRRAEVCSWATWLLSYLLDFSFC